MKMNKYLKNGLFYCAIGVLLCVLGYYFMEQDNDIYKWFMMIGVIVFGFGFLTIVYSLIRKIERRSIQEYRHERGDKHD